MKIQERDGTIAEVFAFYAIGEEKIFYGLPPGYGGLLAYRKEEVTIVDPEITWRAVFFSNGIYHHSLIEDGLLEGLIEVDEESYKKFVAILKAEGSIRQDFPEDLD
ncbi:MULTISPECIES: hypothetical protein [unclassified Serratia (in: enterobacteria)]|uniref:hypothetical protein n=1 Tax=unclassified Serratia (in: enterobacteria) TaxID=2647522 RepID=UPI0027FE751F|nr:MULTISPECIES: hypothetical protein [unclassified Serratia (in: enterobacteria)]MDQ7099492.1 hypothetical protein [Serratia sp. MF2]MDQ7102099.1 hypothetical protein [Serratia sp. MF1(2023)]